LSRDFVGTGYGTAQSQHRDGEPIQYGVHVEEAGKRYSLTQQVRGVATNFKWDGAGPGSNDLARALLWVTTGVEPAWQMYHQFKSEVVSAWPRKVGECWRIGGGDISQWLAGVERNTVAAESAGQTQARLAQTEARELKIEGFANTLRNRR
jgi:hypothetical protein